MSKPCECCGGDAPNGDGYYPYGVYCDACGDTITHPTGYGWCFAEPDGRVHKNHRTEEEKERIRKDWQESA